MSKIFKILFLFLFIVFSAQDRSVVASSSIDTTEDQIENTTERIVSFSSNIRIAENADVSVLETIKVYATGNIIKRGIFRALPTIRNINDETIKIKYEILSVKKDGISEPYHTEIKNGVFNIYVGDKNIFLNPDFYTYEILYKTKDQIGKFKGYDEFYWNVNGTDWEFPIENIQATVTLPTGATILKSSCYTGGYGSQDVNCSAENLSTTKIEFKSTDLKERENLTIAVGFEAGVLKEPSPYVKFLNKYWSSLLLLIVGLYLLYFYYKNWRQYGIDPEKPVVIPQFNAPKNLSPAALGYIDNGEYALNLVTATMVDLAIKGFVDIDEVKDQTTIYTSTRKFDIKRLYKNSESLPADERMFFKKMFGKDHKISIDGKYNVKMKNAVDSLRNYIIANNKSFIENVTHSKIVFKALKIMLFALFFTLIINAALEKEFLALIAAPFIIFFDGLIILLLLYLWSLKSKVYFWIIGLFMFPFFAPLFFLSFYPTDEISIFEANAFRFLLFGAVSLIIFRFLINKPSADNVIMKSEIAGFKMYLGTAEEKQLKFFNPPEMTTDEYEKFLPYAIVFGLEGIWGKRLKDQVGNSIVDVNAYQMHAQFANTFRTSFSSSLAASTVKPFSSYSSSSSSSSRSSSSSSYSGGSSSSGSSGGGSSGGGGGGGGGGGW